MVMNCSGRRRQVCRGRGRRAASTSQPRSDVRGAQPDTAEKACKATGAPMVGGAQSLQSSD
eukprot:1058020-Lingulodinium_polyedra.AAC.1